MSTNLNLIHLLTLLSLGLYTVSIFLFWKSYSEEIRERILISAISFHFVVLLIIILQELGGDTEAVRFESSPALLISICSFFIFLLFSMQKERSPLFCRVVLISALALNMIGVASLHSEFGASSYDLSLLLITHIFSSVLAQVSVVFTLVFSVLLVIVHQALKRRKTKQLQSLPALVPLERMFIRTIHGSFILLLISLLTGFIQQGSLDLSLKLLFSISYFTMCLVTIVLIHVKKLSTPRIAYGVFLIATFLLSTQLLFRLGLISY